MAQSLPRQVVTVATQPFTIPAKRLAGTLRAYTPATFRADAVAGLSVAVVELPQAMAYAYIAGVPPVYGIYTSIVQGLIGAIFSSNDHLATGPTNTQSLLVAATVTQILPNADGALYLQLVIALTLLKGLIQLAFAAARTGNLVRYVSHSVIVGFAAGAGVLIVVGQTPEFLGISAVGESSLPGILGAFASWGPHLATAHLPTIGLGVLALAIVLGLRAWSPLAPGPLVAVIVPAALVWALGLADRGVHTVGILPSGLPLPGVPWVSWEHVEQLLPGALALALLGMIETVSIGKTLATHGGRRISANQEFFSQGFANLVGSFFQNIPGSGSFTRSALNQMAGGRTRLAGIYNAATVAVMFLLLAPLAQHIPLASLAAILFVVAFGLIDWRGIVRTTRTNRSDALVLFITLASALLLPLAYAIYVGIFLNIALYLRRASHLHMAELVNQPGGRFIEREVRDRTGEQRTMFVQLEGDLFFGVADELQDRLTSLAKSPLRIVIVRLKRTHSIDTTVLNVFEQFVRQMQRKNGYVLLCGVRPELLDDLRDYGLVRLIGEKNVFPAGIGVFSSAKQALQRARELLDSSIDEDQVPEAQEAEGWAYEI